jgi:hypothetical protein
MKKISIQALVTLLLFTAATRASGTPFNITGVELKTVPVNYRVYEINNSFPSFIVTQGTENNNRYINTFCLEPTDTYVSHSTYWATIDEMVMYPDNGTVVNNSIPMTLTDNTKKIYAAYLGGALDAFAANAIGLQLIQSTIWAAQKDDDHFNWPYTIDENILNAAQSYAKNDSWKNVKVLNLWGNTQAVADLKQDVQSQIVMVIPEPTTLLLTGLGVAFLGRYRRRHRNA